MLKLINVKRNDNIIEANYKPVIPDVDETGYLKIDLSTGEIIDNVDISYDAPFQTYLIQASNALKAIADQQPYKDEYVHMWY